MKNTVLFSTVFLSLSLTFASAASFEVKPFLTAPSTQDEIKVGLEQLYKSQASSSTLETSLRKSLQFQNRIYSILNQKIAQNKMHNVEISERRLTGNFVKEITIKFDSLIQRPGNHASNKVVARIYEPANPKPFCEYKYPTTILLHHILNQVGLIEDVAKVMSAGVLSTPAIYVVIHMPHYGDRRQGQEEFLNSDFKEFRNNMAQLILDTHLLKNYLETRANVDQSKLTLAGFSLGSVMGLTVGAFDQSYTRYGHLVGGVDMANILMNRVRTRPDSEVAKALKNTTLEEDFIRQEVAEVDPMTWLHRYKNKDFFFLSASRDDIVQLNGNVMPMVQTLKDQGNEISHRINDDTHTPSGNALTKLKNVFLPLLKFTVKGAQTADEVCPDIYSN